MGYKKDKNQIKEHVKYLRRKFKFKGPLHFTDFSNLKTILDEGYLYSRIHCKRNSIEFNDGANRDVVNKASDYVKNCVRFYYRGGTPTLYDNEGIKLKEYCDETHIPIPVYLLFDEELLYLDNTEFADGNATNSEIDNTAKFLKDMDWDAIFHNTWFEPEERDYIVNKRHAELLSEDPVPLTYLKNIIFRCEADLKRAINLFGNDERFMIRESLFSDKNHKESKDEREYNNFIKDYRIGFYKESNRINLVLNLDFNKAEWEKNYDLEYEVLDGMGEDVYVEGNMVELDNKDNRLLRILQRNKSKAIFYEFNDNWSKLNIFMNGYLSIEQPLNEFSKDIITIKKARVSYIKPNVIDLNECTEKSPLIRKFIENRNKIGFIKLHEELNKEMDVQNKNHYIELVSSTGKLIIERYIEVKPDEMTLDIKLECKSECSKIRRYIDNTLCYELELDGIKKGEVEEIMFLNPLI